MINHQRLESVLQTLSRATAEAVAGIEKIAEIHYDRTIGELVIAPLDATLARAWGPIEIHV
ncbi:hypothetical protein ACFPN2_28180 [Steroidobacter flavus]|uniref:Uncharacterized protein n=1 Tax=Steroidobacter flavus TaxID=1842136 RepID=A0ABV8SZH3_9GAMM